jgi:hypothetical protein
LTSPGPIRVKEQMGHVWEIGSLGGGWRLVHFTCTPQLEIVLSKGHGRPDLVNTTTDAWQMKSTVKGWCHSKCFLFRPTDRACPTL